MSRPHARKAPAPKQPAPKKVPTRAGPEPERQIPNLGDCLRAIRFKRRLSLADVSAATGIARSTLSRVESNQLSLTYDKLVQLSQGLGIDLAELLSSPADAQSEPKLTRRAFSPAGGGKVLAVGTSVYRYMCTELSAKHMTPMLADVRARTVDESNGLLAHPGEEFTYVLSGTVQLHTEFYEPLVLETGACVYFDSTMRHTYVSIGDAPAQILCICSVDGTTIQHALARPPAPDLRDAVTRPLQRSKRSRPALTREA